MLGVDVFPTEMVTFWGTNSFVFRDVCWMCFSPVKKPWCFPVLTNLPNATPKLDRKNGTEENPTISPIPISPVHPTFKKGGGGTGAQSGGSTFVLSLLSLEKFFGWQEKNHHPGCGGGQLEEDEWLSHSGYSNEALQCSKAYSSSYESGWM